MAQSLFFVSSSPGKKTIMALTGLFFCFFLVMHLVGNLFIYAGAEAFNNYAEKLHSLGYIITVFEVFLAGLFLLHIITGLSLVYENYCARPVKYNVNVKKGGSTFGSKTMPWTGLLLLVFIIFHVVSIYSSDRTVSIYEVMSGIFSNSINIGLYVGAVLCLAFHLSHGIWSSFQSLGLTGKTYMRPVRVGGYIISLLFAFGFGLIPVYCFL